MMQNQKNQRVLKKKVWFKLPVLKCKICNDLFESEISGGKVYVGDSEVDFRRDMDKGEMVTLRHYMDCYKPKSPDGGKLVHLFEAQDLNFHGVFRLVLALKANGTLADLDAAIRQLWMEPCQCVSEPPHGSRIWVMNPDSFTGSLTLEHNFPLQCRPLVLSDALHMGDKDPDTGLHMIKFGMKTQVDEVMRMADKEDRDKVLQILYQYDFGSRATKIGLCYRGLKRVNFDVDGKGWRELIRNCKPSIPCGSVEAGKWCGGEAEWVTRDFVCQDPDTQSNHSAGTFFPGRFFCSAACAKHSDIRPHHLLPVVNSPRVGCCRYQQEEPSYKVIRIS